MAASEFLLTGGTVPATPASGKTKIYINSSKHVATVDDAGLALDHVTGRALAQSSPADPTGTNNTTGLMMGLAGSITLAFSGRVLVMLSADIANNTGTDGAKAQLYFGTGAAPANAAALTGTTIGGLVNFTLALAAQRVPIALQGVVTGLTVGSTYWFDASLAAVTGGTANLRNVSLTVVEV